MTDDTRDASRARQAARRRRRRRRPVLKAAAVVGGLATAALASAMTVLWVLDDGVPAERVRVAVQEEQPSWIDVATAQEPAELRRAESAPTVTKPEQAGDPTPLASASTDWPIVSLTAGSDDGLQGVPLALKGELAPWGSSKGISLGHTGGGAGAAGAHGVASRGSSGSAGGGSGFASGTGGGGRPAGGPGFPPLSPGAGGADQPGTPASSGPGTASPTVTASGPPAGSPTGGPGEPAPASAPAGDDDTPAPAAAPQPPTPLVIADGPVEGFGPIGGPVTVVPGGILAPGASPGTLTLEDDFALFGGTLEIDIWGLSPGDEYDVLIVEGAAIFDSGVIEFIFTNDVTNEVFTPTVGDTFTFLTTGKGIFGFDGNDAISLVSRELDLVDALDFIVVNDGNTLTLKIVDALTSMDTDPQDPTQNSSQTSGAGQSASIDLSPPPGSFIVSTGTVFRVTQVSAPNTLVLQFAGTLLVLGGVAVRRRRLRATGRRSIA